MDTKEPDKNDQLAAFERAKKEIKKLNNEIKEKIARASELPNQNKGTYLKFSIGRDSQTQNDQLLAKTMFESMELAKQQHQKQVEALLNPYSGVELEVSRRLERQVCSSSISIRKNLENAQPLNQKILDKLDRLLDAKDSAQTQTASEPMPKRKPPLDISYSTQISIFKLWNKFRNGEPSVEVNGRLREVGGQRSYKEFLTAYGEERLKPNGPSIKETLPGDTHKEKCESLKKIIRNTARRKG